MYMHVGYYAISATIAKDIMFRDETRIFGYGSIILTLFYNASCYKNTIIYLQQNRVF